MSPAPEVSPRPPTRVPPRPAPPRRTAAAALLAAAAVLAALFAAGCGGRPTADYSILRLAEAGGRVTLDGQPLEGAVVRFHPADGSPRYAYGQTDADGRYTLNFDSRQPGVRPGKKVVRISTAATGPEVVGGGGPERVPVRYNRDTELTATVDPHGSHTFDFALTSDGEIAEPEPSGEVDGEAADTVGD